MAQSQRKAKQQKTSRTPFIIIGAVVVAAAALALVLSGGGDSTSDTTAPSGSGEYQTVTVTGDALEPLGDTGTDAALGKKAPALSGARFNGSEVTITPGTSGKPTMLVFLAHWCPHCNREIPRLVEWNDKGLVPDGLRVVGITTASRNDQANWPPSEWIQNMKWPFDVMADSEASEAAAAYGVDGYPFMVILDAEGKVVKRTSGEHELSEITAMVNEALGVK